MTQAPTIIELRDLHKRFGGLAAVDGASFAVERNSLTALIGPNGAGKTTVFDLITGFAQPDGGEVLLDGRPIAGLPPHRIVGLGLVRTFQLTRVFAGMTVIDNMLFAMRNHSGERLTRLIARPRTTRRDEAQAQALARHLLDRVELAGKAQDYAGTLSGGQRKLLELARALMTEPKLVLLDEPTAGVSPPLGRRLMDHIDALRRNQDLTFLFIEHDMDAVMTRSDRVIVMAQGTVLAAGSPADIRADPRVIDAYLGAVEPDRAAP